MVNRRKSRRAELATRVANDPFLSDKQLAATFDVSVATIRLDRMALGIPELRKRTREMAGRNYHKLRTLDSAELIGELLEIEVGVSGTSIMAVSEDMVLGKTGVIRGHHLFAQANSLAVAIVDTELALTFRANVKFVRKVMVQERVMARAIVASRRGKRHHVTVESRVNGELAFVGEFVIAALDVKKGDEE